MPHLGGISGTKIPLNRREHKDTVRDCKGGISHLTKKPNPSEVSACAYTIITIVTSRYTLQSRELCKLQCAQTLYLCSSSGLELLHHKVLCSRDRESPSVTSWAVIPSIERDIMMRMLQAGYTDSEEVRLKKAINEVLQADSALKVEDWLKSATKAG